MRKVAFIGAIFLAFCGVAQAHPQTALDSCTATQTITVINQSGIRPKALANVEFATVVQSTQLHAAWGTPCVQFGPGGWAVTLTTGRPVVNDNGSTTFPISGEHTFADGRPSISIETGSSPYTLWARAFTHEIAETLVDPALTARWRSGLVEVCDPVENLTYQLDGVAVSDFVLPNYFNTAAGPWDEAALLTGPSRF